MTASPQSPDTCPAAAVPGRSSTRIIWILLIVFGAMFLLGAALIAGAAILFFRSGPAMVRSIPPYKMAMERLGQDQRVAEKLGQPIRDTNWMPDAKWSVENNSGEARLDFNIEGPKGKAHVHTESRMIRNQWGLVVLTVTPEGGPPISVDTGSAGGEGEAPKWTARPAGSEKPAVDQGTPASDNLGLPSGSEIRLPEMPK